MRNLLGKEVNWQLQKTQITLKQHFQNIQNTS